jgi:2-polyprenyl-3-methyl-5-hydroxy-6-metoxy-1,4-benzoquinol methylase
MSDQSNEGLFSPFLKTYRLKKVSRYIKGRVLDFGCGVGDLGQFCKPGLYLGFDIDQQSLTIARAKYPHLNFTDQLASSKEAREKYDSIILSAVIEHLDDPSSLLIEMKKYLCQDGHIVITTPNPSVEWIHKFGSRLGVFSSSASNEHKSLLGKIDIYRIASENNLIVEVYERFLLGANQLIVLKDQI